MKKKILSIALTLCMLLTAMPTVAVFATTTTVTVDDLTYTFDSDTSTLTIGGTEALYGTSHSGFTAFENLVIEEGVLAIEETALGNLTDLKSASILGNPDLLNGAFAGCSNLTRVYFFGDEAMFCDYLFEGCSSDLKLYGYTGSTAEAYANSNSITFVPLNGSCGATDSDNVTWKLSADGTMTISGTGAMKDYTGDVGEQPWINIADRITSVVVDEGVTRIGSYAFNTYDFSDRLFVTRYKNLTSVIIRGDIIIGKGAFSRCQSLTSVTIEGDAGLENFAFSLCEALKYVFIYGNATGLAASGSGEYFVYCRNIERMYMFGNVKDFWFESYSYPTLYGYTDKDVEKNRGSYIFAPLDGDCSTAQDGSVMWRLSEDGTLTISGEGEMTAVDYWANFVQDGVLKRVLIDGDVIYTDLGITPKYTVTFEAAGKVFATHLFLYDGDTFIKPADPTRVCHKFDGWYTAATGGTKFDVSSSITADITLYARFTPPTYTVSYNAGANGTGTVAAGTKTYGVDFTLSSETFTRTGYTQTGWATTDGGEKVYDLGGGYTDNAAVTLYPVWEVNQYTVTVKPENGETDITITQDYGTTVTAPTLTRDGYAFDGWDKTFPTTMPAESMTITAKWKDITAPVISGIVNGEIYCAVQTVTVSDNDGISSVTVNGNPVTPDTNGQFTLSPAEVEQKIVVTDKAGNQTEMTVTVNNGHTYYWQSENGKYWKKCNFCDNETAKKDIPEITINGADKVCRTQDYTFTFTLPEGVTEPKAAYYPAESDRPLVVTENDGVYTATVSHTEYEDDYNISKFFVKVYAETEDGFDFLVRKEVLFSQEHTGGRADCTHKAKCEVCGEEYGKVNADNHADEKEWSTKNEIQHEQTWKCCGAVEVALENHEWKGGVCTECGYVCLHTGGTATCTDKAKCEVCGEEYGEVNADNHTQLTHTEAKTATVEAEGNTEYWHCEECSKYFSDKDGKTEITLADTVIAKLEKEEVVPEKKDETEAPQTGYKSHAVFWTSLLIISGITAVGMIFFCKKKKRFVK